MKSRPWLEFQEQSWDLSVHKLNSSSCIYTFTLHKSQVMQDCGFELKHIFSCTILAEMRSGNPAAIHCLKSSLSLGVKFVWLKL